MFGSNASQAGRWERLCKAIGVEHTDIEGYKAY